MLNTPNMETTVAVSAVTIKFKTTQIGSEELGDKSESSTSTIPYVDTTESTTVPRERTETNNFQTTSLALIQKL